MTDVTSEAMTPEVAPEPVPDPLASLSADQIAAVRELIAQEEATESPTQAQFVASDPAPEAGEAVFAGGTDHGLSHVGTDPATPTPTAGAESQTSAVTDVVTEAPNTSSSDALIAEIHAMVSSLNAEVESIKPLITEAANAVKGIIEDPKFAGVLSMLGKFGL